MKFLRTVAVGALAAASMALAGRVTAAEFWNTTISEGQYQTFTIKFDGPAPANIQGFTSTWIYSANGQLWDVFNTMPTCALNLSGATDCPMFPAKTVANTWGNTISLYIEFRAKDSNNCAVSPSNTCAIVYRPVDVSLPVSFGEGERTTYEVLSSGGGAVPEPATWAMMIAGFGLVGSALRRRRVAAAA